jgi:hypothetical protein
VTSDPSRRPEHHRTGPNPARRPTRLLLAALFAALLIGFGAGIWGTVMRPPAYEVRGEIVARPASDLILVRHEAVRGLGMAAMELMAVDADPALLDASGTAPGDRVRLAVRPAGDRLLLIRIERVR